MLIIKAIAKIGACHKSGALGSEEITGMLGRPRAPPTAPEAWGMNPQGASGDSPASCNNKLGVAVTFFSKTALNLYPPYVATEAFQKKFINSMMTLSAYMSEFQYWKCSVPDYIALGHQNLNTDNAYFWRDDDGVLDCGVFDWGGFGVSCIGHKMWWSFNCADFDQVRDNLDDYIEGFKDTYHEYGGPLVDSEQMRMRVLITSMENMMFMVAAVPNCFKMCPTKEWATIMDVHDPRVANNIDGKSTLRTTIHVLNNGIRVLEEMDGAAMLEKWIDDVFVGQWKQKKKTQAMIFGT